MRDAMDFVKSETVQNTRELNEKIGKRLFGKDFNIPQYDFKQKPVAYFNEIEKDFHPNFKGVHPDNVGGFYRFKNKHIYLRPNKKI